MKTLKHSKADQSKLKSNERNIHYKIFMSYFLQMEGREGGYGGRRAGMEGGARGFATGSAEKLAESAVSDRSGLLEATFERKRIQTAKS